MLEESLGQRHPDSRFTDIACQVPFTYRSSFRHAGIELRSKKPIQIKWSRGEELWFAENADLDVFAAGADQEEALHEFDLLVIHFYEHYERLPVARSLSEALRLKELYEETF